MRGYQRLKAAGRLGRVQEVHQAVAHLPLDDIGGRTSRHIFGAAAPQAPLVARQYLMSHFADRRLNRALLYSVGTGGSAVVHPMPAAWRDALHGCGFAVARLRSALLWHSHVVGRFGYGVIAIGRHLLDGMRVILGSRQPAPGRFVFFEGLNANCLPQPAADGRSYDFVTWYARWDGRVPDLDAMRHAVGGAAERAVNGVPVVASTAVAPIASAGALLSFVGWGARAITRAAVDMLRGRWWHAMLLSQAATAAVVRGGRPQSLARDYLFHNARGVFRPLWTYEAARAGSAVTFYFYSTNCETFKRPEGYPPQAHNWHLMTWPRYLVWDEAQADFVRRAVGTGADISVTGPIWLTSTNRDLPTLPANAVAVFDVQPWRTSGYQVLGEAQEYVTPATVNRFLSDIHSASHRAGRTMVLKRKRNLEHWLHPAYETLVARLERQPHFVAVDPELAAVRLIERCQAVISLPFTSTALLGRHLGKPSIYYDPLGLVQGDDRAAHGVPIVTGPVELEAWLNAIPE